jgi:signal transduction histidine kinase
MAVDVSGLAGSRRLSATSAAVERTLVWGFLGIRAFDLAQAAVAVSAGSLSKSSNPTLTVGLLIVVAAETLLLGQWLIRRRSVLPFGWPIAADFGLSLCVVASAPAYIPPEDRLDTWTMWAYPVTLSTAVLVAAALVGLVRVLAASTALAITYLAVVALPVANDVSWRATAVVNAVAFPGFALVAFFFARFVRNLASAADTARSRVAELEQDRSRAVVHDLLVYLRIDRFAEADDETRAVMVAQAQAKYEQMRFYVDGTGDVRDLEARVTAILQLHSDLAARSLVDVEPGVHLPEDALEHLERALDTALSNVEQHAPGADVVVSVRSEMDQVAVTVCDDGPGFDESINLPGFGIGQILGRQLEEIGGKGVVQSGPGRGTQVRITIPRGES